jgi:hypothetical protein
MYVADATFLAINLFVGHFVQCIVQNCVHLSRQSYKLRAKHEDYNLGSICSILWKLGWGGGGGMGLL